MTDQHIIDKLKHDSQSITHACCSSKSISVSKRRCCHIIYPAAKKSQHHKQDTSRCQHCLMILTSQNHQKASHTDQKKYNTLCPDKSLRDQSVCQGEQQKAGHAASQHIILEKYRSFRICLYCCHIYKYIFRSKKYQVK